MFLGLDPSTHTGWCLLRKDGTFTAGEVWFRAKTGMERIVAFSDWMTEFLEVNPVELVTIEGYGYANAHTLVTLVEIGTVLRMMVYLNNVKMINVAPNVLKKFATGTGNAKKELIMREVYRRWGFEAKTNNEADAFVLAQIGAMLASGMEGATKAQQDALKSLAPLDCSQLQKNI